MREGLGILGMGVIEECFHFWGKTEASIEELIKDVKYGKITGSRCDSNFNGIPSELELVVSARNAVDTSVSQTNLKANSELVAISSVSKGRGKETGFL